MFGYEVTESDDHSVTVGKILILLACIVGGVVLAYTISHLVGHRLLALLPGQLSRASKYRRCVELCGLWTPPPVDESPALESPAIETATLESPTIASAVSPGSPEGA